MKGARGVSNGGRTLPLCFFSPTAAVCVCVFKKNKNQKRANYPQRTQYPSGPHDQTPYYPYDFSLLLLLFFSEKKETGKKRRKSALLSQEKMDVYFFGVVAMSREVQKSEPHKI